MTKCWVNGWLKIDLSKKWLILCYFEGGQLYSFYPQKERVIK